MEDTTSQQTFWFCGSYDLSVLSSTVSLSLRWKSYVVNALAGVRHPTDRFWLSEMIFICCHDEGQGLLTCGQKDEDLECSLKWGWFRKMSVVMFFRVCAFNILCILKKVKVSWTIALRFSACYWQKYRICCEKHTRQRGLPLKIRHGQRFSWLLELFIWL